VVWPQNHSNGFRRFGLKTGGDGFWRFGLKTCCNGFLWLGLKTAGDGFLQFDLKTGGDGFSRFGLKTGGRFLGLASKSRWWRVSWFEPQNWQLWFGDLDHKVTATVSWFGSENQVGFGLSVAPQNQRWEVGVGHASRSSGLFHVKASLARVFQSGLKTDVGVTTGDARTTITEVASEAS
jgi:hypothetical protein